jgi:SAM-dependent methyltransferase
MDRSNFNFLYKKLLQYNEKSDLRILDFGCGNGDFIHYLRENGIKCDGADTFSGMYSIWEDEARNKCSEGSSIYKIEDNFINVKDSYYDLVVSNQVFEHIQFPKDSFIEINRILKPNGKLIALFPVYETIFEPHAKLYFAHYLKSKNIQFIYFYICALFGIGNLLKDKSSMENAKNIQNILNLYCFNHRIKDINNLAETIFSSPVQYLNSSYLIHKLGFVSIPRFFSLSLIQYILGGLAVARGGITFEVESRKK